MKETNYPVEYLTDMRNIYASRFQAQKYLRNIVQMQWVVSLTIRSEVYDDGPNSHNGVNWEEHTFPKSSIDIQDIHAIVWDNKRRIEEIQRFANFLYNDCDYVRKQYDDDDDVHKTNISNHQYRVHTFWKEMIDIMRSNNNIAPEEIDRLESALIDLYDELIYICE